MDTHRRITTTNTYNDLGDLLTTTDQGGHVTTFDYTDNYSDGTNHSTQAFATKTTYQETANPLAGGYVNHIVSQSYYWPSALLYQDTDQNGQITSRFYDSIFRTTQINFPDGGQTTSSYPSATQVVLQRKLDSSNSTYSTTLVDGYGRTSRTAVANGEPIPYDQQDSCYDSYGRLAFQSYAYQGNGFSSSKICTGSGDSFAYDALGRTTSVTHSDGSSSLISYNGRAVKIQDEGNGSNVRVTHVYQNDGLGRTVTACEEANIIFNTTVTACGLDIGGNVNGISTSYSYDPLGRMKTISQGSLTQRQFTYDGVGNLLSEYIPETKGTTSYTYNSEGLLATRARYSANQSATCIASGTCTTTTTTYAYDELHRLRTVSYTDTASENTPFLAYFYDQQNPYGMSTSPIFHRTNGCSMDRDTRLYGGNSGRALRVRPDGHGKRGRTNGNRYLLWQRIHLVWLELRL